MVRSVQRPIKVRRGFQNSHKIQDSKILLGAEVSSECSAPCLQEDMNGLRTDIGPWVTPSRLRYPIAGKTYDILSDILCPVVCMEKFYSAILQPI